MAKKQKPPDKSSPFSSLKELRDKLAVESEQATARPKPAHARPPAPPAAITSEDEALAFHRMMSGVVPIDRSRTRIPKSQQSTLPSNAHTLAETARAAAAKEAESVHEHLRALVSGGSGFETSDDGRRVEGRRVDVSADMVRKLRRGLFPIDARLDLHGLRAEEAKRALGEFLAMTRAKGERCVLVVHGKGEHSAGGVAVLRGEIAAWLSQGSAREHVSAFATAEEADGGEGAVYVLLRHQ